MYLVVLLLLLSVCLAPYTFMVLISKCTLPSFYYCSFFDSNVRLLCPPCVQYLCRFIFLQVTSLFISFNLLQIYFHLARLVSSRPTDCCSNLTITPAQRTAVAPTSCELRSNNTPRLCFTYIRQSHLIQYNSQHILSALYLFTPKRSHYTVNLIRET